MVGEIIWTRILDVLTWKLFHGKTHYFKWATFQGYVTNHQRVQLKQPNISYYIHLYPFISIYIHYPYEDPHNT